MKALVRYWYFWTMALALLGGCASLGAPAPQSLDQSIAYAYAGVGAAEQSAANALNAKQITVADAQQVQLFANQIRSALDAAKAAETGNPAGAASSLATANAVLLQLQQYLATKGVK